VYIFILDNKDSGKKPIKVWLPDISYIDEGALTQAMNLASLPFIYGWVALMPDVHEGYGMPIGGVIAAENVIIPNAVGVDIGCGVVFTKTNIPRKSLSEDVLRNLVGNIMRSVPTGFQHHGIEQSSKTIDKYKESLFSASSSDALFPEIERAYYQIGTLGGGNHFIEIQEDDEGWICLMVHSGSRNLGKKIADYFNKTAISLSSKFFPPVPKHYDLAYLPVDTDEAREYLLWMDFALAFAEENRQRILEIVKNEISAKISGVNYTPTYHAHHNYAALEHHYHRDVWVHRKGAIRVRSGEIGIIPGAMGSYSFIVKGKGNPESFYSCSHGAGRRMSRAAALKEFSTEQTVLDLKEKGIVLGMTDKSGVADESRFAYKNIEDVLHYQADLVEPVLRLKTVAVIKGSEKTGRKKKKK
jgi:tRNA-splicing ligase RtcB